MEQASNAPTLHIRSHYLYPNSPTRHLLIYLGNDIVRSPLTIFFPLGLMVSPRLAASTAAFIGLVNSLTHIFVIQTGRPVVLGAVIGVNVVWMLCWLGAVVCQIFLTWALDGILEHAICGHEYRYYKNFGTPAQERLNRQCTGQRLGYACAPFAILGS